MIHTGRLGYAQGAHGPRKATLGTPALILSHETPMDTTTLLSSTTVDAGLLALRVALGLYMAAHGAQKLFGWFGGYGLNATGEFMVQLGFKPGRAFAAMASATEVASGILVALGFLGPIGPALMVSVMIVAAVSVHWRHGLFAAKNGIEMALLYAAGAFALALTGPGLFSLDVLLDLQGLWAARLAWAALAIGALGGIANLAARRPAPAVPTH